MKHAITRKEKEMKDSEKLNLQDLDLVSGGLDLNQLTNVEMGFYLKLDKRLNQASADHADGKISEEKLTEIKNDFNAYKAILEAKYSQS